MGTGAADACWWLCITGRCPNYLPAAAAAAAAAASCLVMVLGQTDSHRWSDGKCIAQLPACLLLLLLLLLLLTACSTSWCQSRKYRRGIGAACCCHSINAAHTALTMSSDVREHIPAAAEAVLHGQVLTCFAPTRTQLMNP